MYDGGRIVGGLVVFFALLTVPIWYNVASGKAQYKPEPQIVTQEKACVQPTEVMRVAHMDLLNQWRDAVVRQGKRIYVAPDRKEYVMSLSQTCMKCHPNKVEFCDRCHTYAGVSPYCWDCHIEPKETE